jgi:hypothetical protein
LSALAQTFHRKRQKTATETIREEANRLRVLAGRLRDLRIARNSAAAVAVVFFACGGFVAATLSIELALIGFLGIGAVYAQLAVRAQRRADALHARALAATLAEGGELLPLAEAA